MASPIDNYEMHAAKKYLEYTETPLYRAFRDLDNPVSAASNFAVLKSMEDAPRSLREIEAYYKGHVYLNLVPKFEFTPDSVRPAESRAFFYRNGYELARRDMLRMTLCEKPSPLFVRRRCAIQSGDGRLPRAVAALLVEYCGGQEHARRLIERQLTKGGARAFVAFAADGAPASICVAHGYGSAYCITALYTAEARRRMGYGAAALAAAMRGAVEQPLGYDTIFLETVPENKDAVRLFEKAGFRGAARSVVAAFKGGAGAPWARLTKEEAEELS